MSWTPPKRTRTQRVLYSGTGWLCIVIGIIGGFIPVLQGWVFILAGVTILAREHEWVYNFVQRFKTRYPKIGRWMDKGSAEAERIMNKMLRRVKPA